MLDLVNYNIILGLAIILDLFSFSLFIERLQPIMVYNAKWWQEIRKKKKEYASFYYTFLEKAWRPVRIDKQEFWAKRAKSVPGFKPGPQEQNDVALPLAPPPLPG